MLLIFCKKCFIKRKYYESDAEAFIIFAKVLDEIQVEINANLHNYWIFQVTCTLIGKILIAILIA